MAKQNGAIETLCVSTFQLEDHSPRKKTVQATPVSSNPCEEFEKRLFFYSFLV